MRLSLPSIRARMLEMRGRAEVQLKFGVDVGVVHLLEFGSHRQEVRHVQDPLALGVQGKCDLARVLSVLQTDKSGDGYDVEIMHKPANFVHSQLRTPLVSSVYITQCMIAKLPQHLGTDPEQRFLDNPTSRVPSAR